MPRCIRRFHSVQKLPATVCNQLQVLPCKASHAMTVLPSHCMHIMRPHTHTPLMWGIGVCSVLHAAVCCCVPC